MDRRAKAELFEQIRREYEHGGGTIQGIAEKLGIHRRMVREAVLQRCSGRAQDSGTRETEARAGMAFINAVLEADKTHRTSDLVPDPRRDAGSESGRVHDTTPRSRTEDRASDGFTTRRSFHSPNWDGGAQVDWYEAYADICGERELAYVFCMRSMASGGAFHCAFPHASQQAFLEAHERAFLYFGGVLLS